MTDLDKAREWAESVGNIEGLMPGTRATVEVIQSLPDRWVDAEKLREALEGCDKMTYPYEVIEHIEKTLFTPKLPTLADMTEEEREACRWMQAKVKGSDGLKIINTSGEDYTELLRERGGSCIASNHEVTPLPDLPKLEWPGGVVDAEAVEEPEPAESCSIHTPMQPSEAPANEPWLIEVDGEKAIGTRYQGDAFAPWSVAALDGSFAGDYGDNGITLIHKLVPETHALPEGMRFADHEKFGRVVTSPWGDGDDDYKIFFLNEDARGGADYDFVHESKLTFLDGGQHV